MRLLINSNEKWNLHSKKFVYLKLGLGRDFCFLMNYMRLHLIHNKKKGRVQNCHFFFGGRQKSQFLVQILMNYMRGGLCARGARARTRSAHAERAPAWLKTEPSPLRVVRKNELLKSIWFYIQIFVVFLRFFTVFDIKFVSIFKDFSSKWKKCKTLKIVILPR